MTTRRRLLATFALLGGSGAVASTAFLNTSTSPTADLRIIPDARITNVVLRPGRDDEAYVRAEDDGEGGRRVVEILVGAAGDNGVSKRARTRFEGIVAIHMQAPGPPLESLYFTFEVSDEGLQSGDPTPEDIANALSIVSPSGDIPGEGEEDYLAVTDEGPSPLTPNDFVPFGLGIDLTPPGMTDLPDADRYDITLVIESQDTSGGQGGGQGDGQGGN